MSGVDASTIGTIRVRLHPRASGNRVTGYRDGALQVGVTAPPHGGRANAALLEFLAGMLGVAKSRLSIVRGHSSRDKVVEIEGLETEVIHSLLKSAPRSSSAKSAR